MDMLNHIDSHQVNAIAKKIAGWHIKLLMAKGLFWVSGAIALIVWAVKS